MGEKTFRRKWDNASVKNKITIAFVMPIALILFTNIYMYVSINAMTEKVNQIYVTNITLNELSEELSLVQKSMRDYLENKGTSSLSEYYIAEQEYRDTVNSLEVTWSDVEMAAMRDNIIKQSENYLEVTQSTIQAKRGRNVEKYRGLYEKAETLSEDLQYCIYSLNDDRFKANTVEYSVLLSSLRNMEIITISILIFVGIVNIIIVTFVAKSMTMPLAELAEAAGEVAKGNFEVDIVDSGSGDEIGVVSSAFRQMVGSIQRYITEIRESVRRESELKERELVMESRMKEVQLQSLQAQINPHFLFNTLNAGSQLAMMEGADKTVEFIDNMADFFRYNIKKIDNDASIREELLMVDRYIYILNVRFTGEIHYSKEVDENILDIRIPSMIVQPIVENAVNYGIRGIEWEGHIDLKAYQSGEQVFISIKDNGVGMSQDMIERILSGKPARESDKMDSGSNGVGLLNVIERLQIFTRESDVLSIVSEGANRGTEFIIKVPLGD